MKLTRLLKFTGLSLLAWAVVAFVALMVWYGLHFLPHVDDLKKLSRQGNELSKSVAPSLYGMALTVDSEEKIRAYASSRAYFHLLHEQHPGSSNLASHMRESLWFYASYLHLSEQEVFGLWVECALQECGQGLPAAAKQYFSKDLQQLNLKEQASLVAMIRSPAQYAPGTVEGNARALKILASYRLQVE